MRRKNVTKASRQIPLRCGKSPPWTGKHLHRQTGAQPRPQTLRTTTAASPAGTLAASHSPPGQPNLNPGRHWNRSGISGSGTGEKEGELRQRPVAHPILESAIPTQKHRSPPRSLFRLAGGNCVPDSPFPDSECNYGQNRRPIKTRKPPPNLAVRRGLKWVGIGVRHTLIPDTDIWRSIAFGVMAVSSPTLFSTASGVLRPW